MNELTCYKDTFITIMFVNICEDAALFYVTDMPGVFIDTKDKTKQWINSNWFFLQWKRKAESNVTTPKFNIFLNGAWRSLDNVTKVQTHYKMRRKYITAYIFQNYVEPKPPPVWKYTTCKIFMALTYYGSF